MRSSATITRLGAGAPLSERQRAERGASASVQFTTGSFVSDTAGWVKRPGKEKGCRNKWAPLVIDADAPLAFAVVLERLEPVCGGMRRDSRRLTACSICNLRIATLAMSANRGNVSPRTALVFRDI